MKPHRTSTVNCHHDLASPPANNLVPLVQTSSRHPTPHHIHAVVVGRYWYRYWWHCGNCSVGFIFNFVGVVLTWTWTWVDVNADVDVDGGHEGGSASLRELKSRCGQPTGQQGIFDRCWPHTASSTVGVTVTIIVTVTLAITTSDTSNAAVAAASSSSYSAGGASILNASKHPSSDLNLQLDQTSVFTSNAQLWTGRFGMWIQTLRLVVTDNSNDIPSLTFRFLNDQVFPLSILRALAHKSEGVVIGFSESSSYSGASQCFAGLYLLSSLIHLSDSLSLGSQQYLQGGYVDRSYHLKLNHCYLLWFQPNHIAMTLNVACPPRTWGTIFLMIGDTSQTRLHRKTGDFIEKESTRCCRNLTRPECLQSQKLVDYQALRTITQHRFPTNPDAKIIRATCLMLQRLDIVTPFAPMRE
ncbi:hypothetical protein CPB84DRAFT_1749341 [Gymnopilus junonius]|uniref:Uncharacterized protein n=1 Tax=Gymnopilus junonius TaxID=109634 RepID=A0A9P5NKI2_GYMJU|nr:hypothetical protein CPB84DRAFT_1749341 [Gymnopilus junonius]